MKIKLRMPNCEYGKKYDGKSYTITAQNNNNNDILVNIRFHNESKSGDGIVNECNIIIPINQAIILSDMISKVIRYSEIDGTKKSTISADINEEILKANKTDK